MFAISQLHMYTIALCVHIIQSEKSGRAMKRLVYWYGTPLGQNAYSFVNASQLISYEEGMNRGYNSPTKLMSKIAKGQHLNKKEETLKHGLQEIETDSKLAKADRIKWMQVGNDVKSSKRKYKAATPDEVVSSSTSARSNSPKKEYTAATPDEVVSSNSTSAVSIGKHSKKKVKKEPNLISPANLLTESVPSSSKTKPTPSECFLVVQELGKLHPNIIQMNEERRSKFALQSKNSSMKFNPKNTPITDAIISTMLSQNTTAANQNRAFASLKKNFPTWEQVANEKNTTRIEESIRVAGLAQIRAERMLAMLQTIQEEKGSAHFEYLHDYESTDIVKELSRFKGMGPKTISCVLLFALGKADFPVDTHVLRISKSMNWIPQSFSREAAYEYLNGVVPDEFKLDLHCLLVTHGKMCVKCAARGKPQFPPKEAWVCPMASIKSGKLVSPSEGCKASTPHSVKSENPSPVSSNVTVKLEQDM